MILMDEIFKEIKIRGHLEELKELPTVHSRISRLDEILIQINISKETLSFYSSEEQLYLFFKIQEKEVDLGICPDFYIFYSKRNQRFPHYCHSSKLPKNTTNLLSGMKD